MIITINLKAYPKFIKSVFKSPNKFFKKFVKYFTTISKSKKKILLGILNNPVSVVSVATAFLGIWNDNSTPGLDKIKK